MSGVEVRGSGESVILSARSVEASTVVIAVAKLLFGMGSNSLLKT